GNATCYNSWNPCNAVAPLPGLGTSLVDADLASSTSRTRKQAGSMRQLGEKKRQKSVEVSAKNGLGYVETHSSGAANCG
ncbi:MAG: hypothetical protein ACYTXY_53565, partial [Nostoc sp.]